MRYINVESDFKLLESFDCNCEVNLRDSEFEFEYYTKKHSDNRITVSYKDGKCSSNCKFTKDNRLIVLFENHNLEPGTLKVKRYFNLNDADFSDKTCDFVIEEELPISLTKGIQPCTEECCYIDVKLPPYYQKGDIGPVGPKGDKGDQGDKGDKGDLTVTGATPHNNLLDNTAFNQFDYEDNLSYWNIRGSAEIEIHGGENGIGNNALLIKSYEDLADNTVNPSTLCIKGIGYVLSLYTKAYNNEKRTLLINIPNLHRGLFYVDGQQGKLNNLGYISLEQSTNWEKHYITFTVSGESPIFFAAPSTANDGVLIAQVKLESNPINGLPDLANLMPTPWTLSANDLKGKDIYELLVESNKFNGTREDFEDEYTNSIKDVKNATKYAIDKANDAQMIGQHVQQVERDILQREDERSDAFDLAQSNRQQAYEDAEDIRNNIFLQYESTRQNNETLRSNAEEDRKKAESDRQALFQSNEESRQNTFNTNETTRQNNEIIRQTKEAERETKEAERQNIFSTNEAERQRIFETNEAIREENEAKRVDAEILRQEAETVREATYKNKVDREDNAPKLTAGFANNLIGRGEATPQEISFRPSGGDTSIEDGTARIDKVKGSTLVWNQRAKNNKDISFDLAFVGGYQMVSPRNLIVDGVKAGHKYYAYLNTNYTSDFTISYFFFAEEQSFTLTNGTPRIVTPKTSYEGEMTLRFYISKDEAAGKSVSGTTSLLFVDLTQMFGEGNEPATIEKFHARKSLNIDEYAYNEGELISNNAEELKSVGFNALKIDDRNEFVKDKNYGTDTPRELSENDYWLSIASNGISYKGSADVTSVSIIDDVIRATSINLSYGLGLPMRVLSGTKYRFSCEASENLSAKIGYYDENGVPLGDYVNSDLEFTTPSQCEWIMVLLFSSTGGTPFYVKCPCIHLVHTGYRNGEYEPYKEFRRSIPIKDIKDKDGNQLFPNGLLSAGSVYDEVTATKAIKRIGVIPLNLTNKVGDAFYHTSVRGMKILPINTKPNILCNKYVTVTTIASQSSDKCMSVSIGNRDVIVKDSSYSTIEEIQAATQGVMLYYELAEPIEVDLPEPLNLDYEVSDFGTEEVLSSEPTTPMKADIIYQFNAVDRIRDNSRHTAEAENLLNAKADKTTVETIQKKELQLSVKDNGNIILSNANGESKEFMPATPSGDPLHWAYENMLLGAEFNATDDFKIKQTPWASYVDSIEYKALWNLDVVDASIVQPDSLVIGGISYRYAKDTRKTAYGVNVDRYRVVKQDSATGKWVWDDSVVLHCPRCWYKSGIGDLTNREMYDVWNEYPKGSEYPSQYFGKWCRGRLAFARRSNFSITTDGYALANNAKVEVSDISLNIAKMDGYFYGAENLRYIHGTIQVVYATATISSAFARCSSLTYVYCSNLKVDLSFNYSPKINKKSILYIINNCSPTKAITITLHADAYARLNDDTEVIAALENKNAALQGTGGSVSIVSA